VNQAAPDLYLIAHSHGVSLLDGITDWRERLKGAGGQDPRYGNAFQAWLNGSIIGDPFQVGVIDNTLPFKNMEAWVLSSRAEIGTLAELENTNGAGIIRINEKFSRVLGTWNGSSPIVSMLYGNEYASTMLNWMPAYDFLDPEIPGIETNVPIIDDIFIEQSVSTWLGSVYSSLVAIKRLVKNKLIHILPPPPRENPQLSPHLENFGDHVAIYGFLSDRLRLKWYRRYCRHLTASLTAIDCQVLAPPRDACNANGLLKEEYAEGITHGNGQYGILLAQHLASSLEIGP
jgi:hypothetical protein